MNAPVPTESAMAAAAAYGLDGRTLVPVASVYRSVAAYRAGSVLLKPYRYRERQLYYVTMALQHLEKGGCRCVPRLVHAKSGKPYVRLGETWWYATTWIEGRPPQFPTELYLAAQALAQFHRASEGCFIPWSHSRSWRNRWGSLLLDLLSFSHLARAGSTPFDAAYAHAANYYIQRTEEAICTLDDCDYDALEANAKQRRAFCHRDCTADNLVVGDGGKVFLVDPDTWGPELRLHDLVRLLTAGAPTDPKAVLRGLAAYEVHFPLHPMERRLLPAALMLPREFWWAGVCRYKRAESSAQVEQLLRSTVAGAPQRDACIRSLWETLGKP
jgi:CotS family spore coat protein